MKISKQRLEEFKQIYFKQHGEELDDEESMEKALDMIKYIEILKEGAFDSKPPLS